MQGQIPDAFEQVSLGDRSTWHRATLRDWLELRDNLLEKQRNQGDLGEWSSRQLRALMEANSRLAMEMRIGSGRARPPIGGDVDKRRTELMKELFYDKYPDFDPLSEWEVEFLKQSEWLEQVIADYDRNFRRSNIGLLFTWLMDVEDELKLRAHRQNQRLRYRAAVAPRSDRRLKSRKNPFYPSPAELVRIAAAADIVIENYKRDFAHYLTYGEPVPGTESVEDFHIRDFLRNGTALTSVERLIDALRQYGYLLCRSEFACRDWPDWKESLRNSTRAASRSLLAFIFDVNVATIRKSLSRGVLTKEYNRFHVAEAHRVYPEPGQTPNVANLLRSGWTHRIVDGAPSRYDSGRSYFCMPPLDLYDI